MTEDGGVTRVDIAIIGAGFAGLGTAIRLRQQGREDFVVLERHDDVGGTWWANTYPGCTCDVPSHLYSLSFAPNPEWTHTYSPQPEIRAYLQRIAAQFDLYPHIRLGTTVTGADWDDETGRWTIATSGGTVSARVLVAGIGPLSEPRVPDLPGLDEFEGAVFHSARWDHEHDLTGERVAAIGTGASAIQFVPAIQPTVARLSVFQRSAPWVIPHFNRRITERERRLYRRLPLLQKLVRAGVYASREALVLGFVKQPRLMKLPQRIARRRMRDQVSDPALRARVTPDYTIGCKRVLPSNGWYRALVAANVELVDSPISAVRARSIVTADGAEHAVDAIILATGFRAAEMPIGTWVRGRGGRLLADTWAHSPRAYLGTTMPGFPNLFLLLGPNTGLAHTSVVYMIESQINLVLDALRVMDERGAAVAEVEADVAAAYIREIDAKLAKTVWNTGCGSWYLDETGRNPMLWPDWTWRFRQRTRRFDAACYRLARPYGPSS